MSGKLKMCFICICLILLYISSVMAGWYGTGGHGDRATVHYFNVDLSKQWCKEAVESLMGHLSKFDYISDGGCVEKYRNLEPICQITCYLRADLSIDNKLEANDEILRYLDEKWEAMNH